MTATPGPWTWNPETQAVEGPDGEWVVDQLGDMTEADGRRIAAVPEMERRLEDLAEAIIARVQRGLSVGGECDSLAHGALAFLARVRENE